MLVQVFLASAERGGAWRRWAGVCGPKRNLGEKPAIPLSHITKPTAPSHLHSPFMKSDNMVGGKQQGLSSGFSTRSDIPQF